MFRIGLFNLGLGLMSVLTVAVINRVMISELAIPGTITAGVVAVQYFISPTRVWFGQMSDSRPLFGLHRTGYVRIGTVIFGIAIFLSVQVVWQLGGIVAETGVWEWNGLTLFWTGVLILIFLLYGLAISASSTPFTALLVDISSEQERSRIVAVVWSMLMVGIILGGITGKIFLTQVEGLEGRPLDILPGPINSLFLVIPLIVVGLSWFSTWKIERKYSLYARRSSASDREDSVTLLKALKVLTVSRQTGIFFSFLLLVTISLFLQEAVLEPYGGEIFKMSIGDTTMLNSYWGIGILVGYSITGFALIPRFGKTPVTKVGCGVVAGCFLLIILAGFTQNPLILKGAMLLFGLAAGVTTLGAISLMLDLTVASTAGTFIGTWGLSQALARGIATWSGGIILDIGKQVFSEPLWAYGSVFLLQAIVMIGAMFLLAQVDVTEFRNNTKEAIATVMEGDLD
ncbi:BCD family MFS transporter [Spirulina subsalsa FACHB-351]|uniref:BCD family MFS transporter n=2 Tax=Spirulina subsalsa TaxID=54311 RepID=A0ABT3L4B0_9CYAN|nr:BCD family MFS transporter [Spirulina subsalsa]MCW6036027.1 BCD family MFS transporter [Spirulina subsalsa FACHB-351]